MKDLVLPCKRPQKSNKVQKESSKKQHGIPRWLLAPWTVGIIAGILVGSVALGTVMFTLEKPASVEVYVDYDLQLYKELECINVVNSVDFGRLGRADAGREATEQVFFVKNIGEDETFIGVQNNEVVGAGITLNSELINGSYLISGNVTQLTYWLDFDSPSSGIVDFDIVITASDTP